MNKQFIKPEELRGWWPQIRRGLEYLQRKTPEEWIPEDIYSECMNGRALAFVGTEGAEAKGFLIVQPMGKHMHVWAAWSLINNEEFVIEGLKFAKDLARQSNAKYLTFSSHRKGWTKRAAEFGFVPRQWICEV